MPGEGDLGDLIVTLKLDDSQYRQDLKETLTQSAAAAKQLFATGAVKEHAQSLKKVIPLSKELNLQAQEAHQRFGVMANAVTGASTTLRLFGIESGFAVVEAGRMALYLGRATTAAGGLATGFVIIGKAVKGFLVTIGPVGWALLALGTAYTIITRRNDALAESTKKSKEELASWQQQITKTDREIRVLMGTSTPAQVRRMELKEQSPTLSEGRIDLLISDELLRDQLKIKNATMDRVQALRLESSILRGEGTQYDLIGDAAERIATMERDRLKTLKELEKQRDELLAREHEEGGGFGIGTIESRGFRFGAGAIGSVIGEQNETKKTNALLEKSLTKLDAQIGILQKLVEPTTGDN
jgi:hypothetical protein